MMTTTYTALIDDLPSKDTLIWQIRELQSLMGRRSTNIMILLRKNYWTLAAQHRRMVEHYVRQAIKEDRCYA